MASLLHISVSPRAASHSRRIGRELAARLCAARDFDLVVRDLGAAPPPLPDEGFVEASLMPEERRGPDEVAALALSETYIAELEAAAVVVIDTPMHNFTVPAALKAWIDHVVRPRRTFRSTPAGKVGLLADRPIRVVAACGGPFSGTPAAQRDFLTPYISYTLAAIGLADVEVLLLESLARGAESVERAETGARAWIERQG